MFTASPPYAEHPQDVLQQWLSWRRDGSVALAVISDTVGGSVRSEGALMAVAANGQRCGYVSGGCIDADVALQAQEALAGRRTVELKYGVGSPFIDMPLPCGGAIELKIFPDPDENLIRACHDRLLSRMPATLPLQGLSRAPAYFPKLRVRIAGRGADALALARLVRASGYDLVLQLRDGNDTEEALKMGLGPAQALQSTGGLPPLDDDEWTAFVLMFHDPDWETALLHQAIGGKAFYIGAVGSPRTQAQRRERLLAETNDMAVIDRIRGPVGLVPSMRDASMLAISALAEIIEAYRETLRAPLSATAVLLLAAGQSRRFESGDKLLAPLNGASLLEHAASALAGAPVAARIAVTGPDHDERRSILNAAGWQILTNPDARSGQASSIRTGIRHIAADHRVDQALILLADMPFVPDDHLRALQTAVQNGAPAAISSVDGVECPPAMFSRSAFPELLALEGDAGAKSVYKSLTGTRSIALPASCAIDIDTSEDLVHASAFPAAM